MEPEIEITDDDFIRLAQETLLRMNKKGKELDLAPIEARWAEIGPGSPIWSDWYVQGVQKGALEDISALLEEVRRLREERDRK